LLTSLACASALPPPPASCSGTINSKALNYADDAPVVNTTAGGSTKQLVTANLTAPLSVLHVFGSIYEMNRDVGLLMSEEMALSVPAALLYLYQQVNASYNLTWLPEPVRDWVVEYGVDAALDLTFNATSAYSPAHWADAFEGLAAGSGVDLVSLRRVAMIAEWTRASCRYGRGGVRGTGGCVAESAEPAGVVRRQKRSRASAD
jgi:hypothetical protein